MGANELHAMQHFFLNADFRALLDLVDRQVGLGFTPSLDTFKQGSAFIHRTGLTGREYVIKVQMRIAERRADKFAAQIDYLNGRQITTLRLILLRESGAECGEHTIRDENVLQWQGACSRAAGFSGGDMCVGEQCGSHRRSFNWCVAERLRELTARVTN